VPWHQDASFWKLSPARTVTVWLAIDDADEENAAMRFIPGTHDKGEIETVEMGEGSVFHKGIANAEQYGEPFVNALKAGQMSLHADMLMHGSGVNRSDPAALRSDTALLPAGGAHHRSEMGAGRRGDHRTGAGRVGPLAHHPRPENDDILATARPMSSATTEAWAWCSNLSTAFPHPVKCETRGMEITWLGHAAFKLTDASGRSVITDPYTPEGVGYAADHRDGGSRYHLFGR
jgi:hypothetical protein